MLPSFTHISTPANSTLLTIDDGPNPETTPLLLQVLERYQVKALFFVCGKKVRAHPELTQSIVQAGHGLYSHAYSHKNFETLSQAEIIDELAQTEQLLAQYRPTPTPYLFRLPYGQGTQNSLVNEAAASWRKDLIFIQWSLSPVEWSFVAECKTPSDIEQHCNSAIQKLKKQDWTNTIILLHDWPVFIEDEQPQDWPTRPYFCASLLEKLIVAGIEKQINFAKF
jgi:peptidoglycan/xylan/chitin deacetylase (PgdA/CDA1 family)